MRVALQPVAAAFCLSLVLCTPTNAQSPAAAAPAVLRASVAAEATPTVVVTARRTKRRPPKPLPLVLSVPRFSFENIANPSTISGSFNSTVNYLQREMHTAHHMVEDISLFRFRLTADWSLQWDFNRQTQPSDRVLAFNVGLYHDF